MKATRKCREATCGRRFCDECWCPHEVVALQMRYELPQRMKNQ